MKRIAVTIVALFLVNSLLMGANYSLRSIINLQGTFSGKITDGKDGQPIVGASVYVADIKAGTFTNNKGEFIIHNISEGNHLIEISHIGYTTVAVNITISGDTQKDFILSESIVENNAVVVTGVSGATQLKKVPFHVSVLRKEDFFKASSTNVMESLTKMGGVSTLSTGPAISKPVIRGLGYNRVLTINDGVRQEGQQWGDEHGIEIDEASVNKVELLKGPASIIYGSDAMAGVINIITNVPVANNTVKANISSNYQTNNKLRSINANIGANKNGVNWNLYTSNKWAVDYKNKYDGYVYNSKFNEHNVGGYVGYNGKWGYSHLLLSNFNLKTGLVEGERDMDGYFIKPMSGGGEVRATHADFKSTTPRIPYQHVRHFKIATDNNFKLGKNRLTFNLGFQRNKREEFGNIVDLNERELYFDLKTFTYTAQYLFAEMDGWKTSIGLNGMQQYNSNKGVEQLIPDYKSFNIGGYAYIQKTIKKLTLSGGIRYDSRNIDAQDLMDGIYIKQPGFKKSFFNFSGSIGLAAQATDKLNVKLNIARAFRAPSIPELASNGSHEGTLRYEYGDKNLKSEISTQLDGGVEFNTEHISFSLSAFYNNFSNFIFYKKLESVNGGDSTITVDGENLTTFKFDQRKATISGLEAVIDIHPHPLDWLHIQNTFSWVNGRFKQPIESNQYLPFIPAPRWITEFRGNFNKLTATINNFYVKFEIDNAFRQNRIFSAYNTETTTAGYTLLNAGMGTDFVNKKNQTLFSISFSAINLRNVAYQNHLSRLKYAPENSATGRIGVFNMGRNFSIKVNVPLSLNWGK